MTSNSEKWYAIALFGVVFFIFLFFMGSLIDGNSIVADGYQNLSVAKNIVDHSVFSSGETGGRAPTPDMLREPAWPFLTAIFIYIFSLDYPTGVLASEFSSYFKYLNLSLYALIASVASCWVYLKTKQVIFGLFCFSLFLLIYGTTPRLINNFNNEALATLFLLAGSILFYKAVQARAGGYCLYSTWIGTWPSCFNEGSIFIYLCPPPGSCFVLL